MNLASNTPQQLIKGNQLSRVMEAFSDGKPKTMLMVSIETGIKRSSICGRLGDIRKLGVVEVIERKRCKVSTFKANFYIINP